MSVCITAGAGAIDCGGQSQREFRYSGGMSRSGGVALFDCGCRSLDESFEKFFLIFVQLTVLIGNSRLRSERFRELHAGCGEWLNVVVVGIRGATLAIEQLHHT